VRRLVLLADVRLDLDDPPGTQRRPVVPDQPATEQRPPELERRQLENVASRPPYRGITVT
jgi:hypothetical protein